MEPGDVISVAHHESVYFPDGDIVLSALDDKRCKILFRVHKFILSHHSPVFKGMFTLPQPPTQPPQNSEAQCGVVQVVDMPDRAEDFASLLSVLYDPSKLPYKRYNPDTPLLVKGILTLATKYEIDNLRSRIIEQIKSDWPSTLSEWDLIESHNKCIQDNDHVSDEEIIQLEPGAAIELARLFDIPSILPAAFLQLCRTKPLNIWDRAERESNLHDYCARWDLLSSKDHLHLQHGAHMLLFPIDDALRASSACRQRSQCETFLKEEWLPAFYVIAMDRDYFCASMTCASSISKHHALCAPCVEEVPERLMKRRGEVWDSLRTWFNL
ncbi:hypothetical protein BD410DRAFT_777713 [Rickenella mellea]|uniref:BTB domain-containing protein n=1 Tax=Rickenella mellea TaxID=50990 RepID=A0A4Y7PK05_9AGAM|nr:hypothetical protein BD410DRAFT_777713 [Rickenella mellea]